MSIYKSLIVSLFLILSSSLALKNHHTVNSSADGKVSLTNSTDASTKDSLKITPIQAKKADTTSVKTDMEKTIDQKLQKRIGQFRKKYPSGYYQEGQSRKSIVKPKPQAKKVVLSPKVPPKLPTVASSVNKTVSASVNGTTQLSKPIGSIKATPIVINPKDNSEAELQKQIEYVKQIFAQKQKEIQAAKASGVAAGAAVKAKATTH